MRNTSQSINLFRGLKSPHVAVISLLIGLLISTVSSSSLAQDAEIFTLDLNDEDSVDVRHFKAEGDSLLLGFACDEGSGEAESHTASLMAEDHLEVWMPDLLGAHFLPKLKSSLKEIPDRDVVALIDAALAKSSKKLYLIASGPGSAVLMRGLAAWETKWLAEDPAKLGRLNGALLLFPRLAATAPAPGQDPVYIDAVGKTRTPIAILEGAKTPNRWALKGLQSQLAASGAIVTTALIPGVRGYFYERDKPNLSEAIVTDQLSGLIKASLIKLDFLRRAQSGVVTSKPAFKPI